MTEQEISNTMEIFDIKEVHEGCLHRDGTFCVPTEGLELVMDYLNYAP